jgi:rRNA biogenesis protein RRP5
MFLHFAGVLVGLSQTIRAFCPKSQVSDNAKVKKVGSMFRVGASVKCRVLVNTFVDGKRQLIVTHKKSLIDSVLPPLTSYQDAVVGAAHHCFITSVKPNGCVVKFFNNVSAFIPRVHLVSAICGI